MGDLRHGGPTLATYLSVLRRRIWIVLLCAILAPAAATYFSVRQTPQYEATADVYIDKQNLSDVIGIPERVPVAIETQASLAAVPEVARRALRLARVSDRMPADFLGQSRVAPKGLTDILEFSVVDINQELARRLATSYAKAFASYRGQLDTQALSHASRRLSNTLAELRSEGREDTDFYRGLEESQQQFETLEALQTSRARVIRTAEGAAQISPRPVRNALIGIALGLALGLGLALLLEALDTRVRSVEEIGERLGLTLLARIPSPAKKLKRRNRLVSLDEPRAPQAEAFRMLRTSIEFATLDTDTRSILVTSALEGEGKSTTAANLAVTCARAGARVALVDLDLRRPFIAEFFSMQGRSGVTNVALRDVELDDALVPVELGDAARFAGDERWPSVDDEDRRMLFVLPAGPVPADPGEFVGSRRLSEILVQLRDRFEVVVIDAPPLLGVGDAVRLSSQVDGVILVTRPSLMRRGMLTELSRLLDRMPAQRLGFVVTGSHRDDVAQYHGYGYGGLPRSDELSLNRLRPDRTHAGA